MAKRWNNYEKDILKKYYGKITAKEISEKYLKNRTKLQIYDYAHKLKLSSNLKVVCNQLWKDKVSFGRKKNCGLLNETKEESQKRYNNYKRKWNINNPEKKKESCRKWDINNPEKKRGYSKRYMKKYPLKVKAQQIAFRFIKIPEDKLCEICNINKAINRHHPNYNLPLQVKLLCIPCHVEIHRRAKFLRN